jgi:hypothetical protein
MITNLKFQIEEDKIIEEALKEQLEERDRIIENLEAEIVTLRKDVQKKNMQNNSKVLDDIINSKKPHHDKTRLGYNQTEKGSISKTTEQETYPKRYAKQSKALGRPTKKIVHSLQQFFYGSIVPLEQYESKCVSTYVHSQTIPLNI